MNDNKRKKILLVVGIILACVLVAGGTYAYLTFSVSVTNGTISGNVECFEIDYSIMNFDFDCSLMADINGDGEINDGDLYYLKKHLAGADGEYAECNNCDINGDGEVNVLDMARLEKCLSNNITGTLFPSAGPSGGLSGRIKINVNESCNVTATGTLYLNVDSGTSTTLVQTVADHCENKTTLETLNDYTTSAECTADSSRMWVSTGTGLKYAVYSNADATGTPLDVGYITNSDIGGDIPIYSDFTVDTTASSYYIFIWMDGYITDSTYTELPFGGYIHASVLQNEE